MKIKELRELSKDELVARRSELKKQALDSRVQQAGGQLENTAIFRSSARRWPTSRPSSPSAA